ncbi:hypothetical protein WJM97_18070 [Okeanomitos corallinicola TIOX110]|uniref:Uncharacterized protein n=1 Tax=Okeanomitos corallinicola TIOX110 TaxID=3133117 RepID=A0ABZ2UPR1_9CYAN
MTLAQETRYYSPEEYLEFEVNNEHFASCQVLKCKISQDHLFHKFFVNLFFEI